MFSNSADKAHERNRIMAKKTTQVAETKHECPDCGRTFKSDLAVKIHGGQVHKANKPKADKPGKAETLEANAAGGRIPAETPKNLWLHIEVQPHRLAAVLQLLGSRDLVIHVED